MTNCHICGRAMVTGSAGPLDICQRARCEPEHEHLTLQWAESLNTFSWLREGQA